MVSYFVRFKSAFVVFKGGFVGFKGGLVGSKTDLYTNHREPSIRIIQSRLQPVLKRS